MAKTCQWCGDPIQSGMFCNGSHERKFLRNEGGKPSSCLVSLPIVLWLYIKMRWF